MSATDDRRPVPAERLGYAEALEELEGILARLERQDVDVDVLGQQVARAAELIKVCRERIEGTRLQVERIVADLDGDTDDEAVAAAGDGGDEPPVDHDR